MHSSPIQIEEILRQSIQGTSEPYLCRDSNNQLHFVKGKQCGRRGMICELVGSILAQRFGLPIAPFGIAEIDEALIEISDPSSRRLGSGLAFASEKVDLTQEITLSNTAHVPIRTAMDIAAFDWWTKNADRTLGDSGIGNPNLLWQNQTNSLVVIDHNLAFDPDFNDEVFLQTHIFRMALKQIVTDVVERALYEEKFDSLLRSLEEVHDMIPCSWWEVDEGVPTSITWDEIRTCLSRHKEDNFWKST